MEIKKIERINEKIILLYPNTATASRLCLWRIQSNSPAFILVIFHISKENNR